MANTIAILDDEPDRIDVMVPLLQRHFPNQEVRTFDNAPEMILWFRQYLDCCTLICLDHDLGPNRTRDGTTFDPGIGRDVVNFLATCNPVCPIVIHTTNAMAAPGMEMALGDVGWNCFRVVPYGDTTWITESWIEEVQKALT